MVQFNCLFVLILYLCFFFLNCFFFISCWGEAIIFLLVFFSSIKNYIPINYCIFSFFVYVYIFFTFTRFYFYTVYLIWRNFLKVLKKNKMNILFFNNYLWFCNKWKKKEENRKKIILHFFSDHCFFFFNFLVK